MYKAIGKISATASVAVLLGSLFGAPVAFAEEAKTAVEKGKEIAFNRKTGNCLACHQMAGGSLPGNIGPPLVAMSARYPDKAKLREQIHDPNKSNPNSSMPPFGRHGILTEEEVDLVTEYVHTL
jgi:sulfur-oxidizing protein SoxX